MVAGDRKSIEAIRAQLLDGAAALAHQARLLYRSRAVVLWLTAMILFALALLWGDIVLRVEELGLRLLALATLVVTACGLAFVWLRPAWRFSPTRIDVAKWVERSRPESAGSLATVVQLCEVDDQDPRYGSLGFRRQTIAVWAESKKVPAWGEFLDTSKWWQALAALTAALALLVVLAIAWPAEMRLAAARLLMPWSSNPWPKVDRLEFLSPPSVVAIGTPVQMEVSDRHPPLPADIELIVREIGASDSVEPMRIATTNVGDVAVGNLPRLENAIEVRAVGGDDDSMNWHRIDVVQAPAIETFAYFVQPPEYSGRSARELNQRRVRVLAGSRVRLSGQFSEPLQAIEVVAFRASEPPSSGTVAELAPVAAADVVESTGRERGRLNADSPRGNTTTAAVDRPAPMWTVSLTADQQGFLLAAEDGQPLLIDRTLQWQLRVTTLAGLQISLPEPWSIDIEADLPPSVVLLPATMTQVTAAGQIQVRGEASDDIELARVAVFVKYPGEVEAERIELFPDNPGVPDDPGAANKPTADDPPVESRASDTVRQFAFDRLIELASRQTLPPGSKIEIYVEAVDSLGQVTRTPVQAFDIRSVDDMLLAMQSEQQQLLSQVRQLLDSQRANERLTNRIAEQIQSASEMRRKDVESLATATRVQQSIASQLADEPGGLLRSIRDALSLYAQNQLSSSIAARELEDLQRRVEQLKEGEISGATSATAEALQSAQLAMDSGLQATQTAGRAQQAAAAQSQATTALQGLLDELAAGESVQQLQQELAEVLQQQEVLQATTDSLQLDSLSGGNAADFVERRSGVRADQQELARRVDELQRRASALKEMLGASEGDVGERDLGERRETIERAAQALGQQAVGERMREAAQQISNDQFVAANASQQAAAEGLQQALRQLGSDSMTGGASELTQQAQQLRQAGQALSQLADRQANLASELASPAAPSRRDSLADQQAELREATADKAEQMQSSVNRGTQQSVQQSLDAQQQATQAARSGAMDQAAESSRTAAEKLAQSARDVQERADQIERVARQQQLFQLSSELNELVDGQEAVVQRLLGMDSEDVDSGLANQIATEQEALRLKLRDVRREIRQLPTFDWAMQQADNDMLRSSAEAQRLRIDPEARDSAMYALNRLQMAANALASSREQRLEDADEPSGGQDADEPNAGEQEKGRLVPPLASLKLLRALQQDVHNQTVALNDDFQSTSRTQRLEELAVQQQALGEQLTRLLRELAQSRGE